MPGRASRNELKIVNLPDDSIDEESGSVRIFASAIAHDINNILFILDYYCGLLLRDDFSASDHPETWQVVPYALSELKGLSRRLMTVGRGDLPYEHSEFDLPLLIENTLKLLQKHEVMEKRSFEYSGLDALTVHGDQFIIRQILINLVLNAAQATGDEGTIQLVLKRKDQNAFIEIHDSGPGIPTEQRGMIFEGFYSTRRQGSGMGLLSVRKYAEIHNWEVTVTDSHLGGACFRIKIPLLDDGGEQRA